MIRVLLVFAALGLLLWGLRWFIRTPPREVLQKLRGPGAILFILALLLLALLAKNWIVPVAAGLLAVGLRILPYLPRLLPILLHYRKQAGQQRPGGAGIETPGPNSVEEAYALLGLNPGARREEIIAAHRRLMQKVHPDRGGSDFLAAQINRAKEILLKSGR